MNNCPSNGNNTKCFLFPTLPEAAPCQNFSSAIFRSVNVRLNDTTVCHIPNYGAYCQLSLMLNTNNNDSETRLKNCLFEKDTTKSWDDSTTNEGWKNRRNHFGAIIPTGATDAGKFMFQKDAEFFMFQVQTYLPAFHFLGHCDTVFDFELAKSDYVFQSSDKTAENTDINYEIEDMRLLVSQMLELTVLIFFLPNFLTIFLN